MNKGHPIFNLRKQLLENRPNLILEFSRYVHKSYGQTLSREILHVDARDVTPIWLQDQIDCLTGDQELAFHSKVKLPGGTETFHLPMIDFIISKSSKVILSRLEQLDKALYESFYLYRSGNSFHGYSFQLLPESMWLHFLGRILLFNLPPQYDEEVVDARWVGHSLVHGFSSLRWSKNSD